MKWILPLLFISNTYAATIAVIDSGLDVQHTDMNGNIWINSSEIEDGRDSDGNGYPDDIHGWNFAEQSNKIIDMKYTSTYLPDVFKFFEIQGRLLLGTATPEDRDWLQRARQDKELISNLQKFGNFVHGTHVAGIAVKNSQNLAMGVKLIPTEIKPFMETLALQAQTKAMNSGVRMRLVKSALNALAKQQMDLLEEIALYVAGHKAEIANGSFGTGYEQAKMIAGAAFRVVFFRAPKEDELKEVSMHFINALISEGIRMVSAAPKTLFVFAAGNDGTNNDEFPFSPTNIQSHNVISVAATYDVQFLAPFSNYGAKTVDVAAPGMLIDSAIPANRTLAVSGTSQAAPYVANVAAQLMEANPTLTPKMLKDILMGTVDRKDFLRGKVAASGIINPNRALRAAELSNLMTITAAIATARTVVRDMDPARQQINSLEKVEALSLAPMFK
jgi:cell wall-associated protease